LVNVKANGITVAQTFAFIGEWLPLAMLLKLKGLLCLMILAAQIWLQTFIQLELPNHLSLSLALSPYL